MRTVLEQLAQDLRYGVRGLRRSRAFLMTTVLTLAVGVGLLAVAFTVVNAYVLRPYAVRDPQQLHQVGWRSRDDGGQSFRWREYQELRERTDVFDAAVAESTRFISSNGRPLAAALVSDNYFEALGPAVFMGRTWRARRARTSKAWCSAIRHGCGCSPAIASRPSHASWTSTAGCFP